MRPKNIYSMEFRDQGDDETRARWILANTFQAATKKAQEWLAREHKKTGANLRLLKIEFEGDIDIF